MHIDDRDVLTELAACRPDLSDVALDPDERLLARIFDSPLPPAARRARPRAAIVVSIGAVAAAGILAVTLVAPGSTPDRADALVRDAVSATATAVVDGRVRIVGTATANGQETVPFEHIIDGADNWSLDILLPDGVTITNRVVAGEFYFFDGTAWTREIDQTDSPAPKPGTPDVTTMLADLDHAAFETVGDEDVDGVLATHLRAATPTAVDARAIGYNALLLASRDDPVEQVVTALDVWVADDVVRRIDIAATQTRDSEVMRPDGSLVPGGPWVENIEISLTFHHADDSVTIVAPTHYTDVNSAG